MELVRWLIRNVPKGATFHLKVTPTGPVSRAGDWYEPDPDNPRRNTPPPSKSWTSAELRAGVTEPLRKNGRYFADVLVRPGSGGSADVEVWIEKPAGNRIAERRKNVQDDANFTVFVYV